MVFPNCSKSEKEGSYARKTFVLKSGTQKYSEKVLFYKVHENGFFAKFKFVSNFVRGNFSETIGAKNLRDFVSN